MEGRIPAIFGKTDAFLEGAGGPDPGCRVGVRPMIRNGPSKDHCASVPPRCAYDAIRRVSRGQSMGLATKSSQPNRRHSSHLAVFPPGEATGATSKTRNHA